MYCNKPALSRPLPPTNTQNLHARSTLKHRNADTLHTQTTQIFLIILSISYTVLLNTQSYEKSYTAAQTCTTPLTWLYSLIIFFIVINAYQIYAAKYNTYKLSAELQLATLLILTSIQLYYYTTNIFILVVLLECQGAAFLLFIVANNELTTTTRTQTTLLFTKLNSKTGGVNALVLQF